MPNKIADFRVTTCSQKALDRRDARFDTRVDVLSFQTTEECACIAGCLHITLEIAVLTETFMALDAEVQ